MVTRVHGNPEVLWFFPLFLVLHLHLGPDCIEPELILLCISRSPCCRAERSSRFVLIATEEKDTPDGRRGHWTMPSEFPIIASAIDTSSSRFLENTQEWKGVMEKHEDIVRWCVSEGQPKYVKRHIDRGMLLSIIILYRG